MKYLFNHSPSSFLGLLVLSMALLISCRESEDQQQFEEEARSEPEGITEMSIDGNEVISEDDDDWRISPMYKGLIRFNSTDIVHYPYPNPANRNDFIKFDLYITQDAVNAIRLVTYSENDYWITLETKTSISSGYEHFEFRAGDMSAEGWNPSGLHRLLIYDQHDNLITYGDIKIQ